MVTSQPQEASFESAANSSAREGGSITDEGPAIDTLEPQRQAAASSHADQKQTPSTVPQVGRTPAAHQDYSVHSGETFEDQDVTSGFTIAADWHYSPPQLGQSTTTAMPDIAQARHAQSPL